MSIEQEPRRNRAAQPKCKSVSPQVKPFSAHKKSSTRERLIEYPPLQTKKIALKEMKKKKNLYKAQVPADSQLKYYVGWGNNEGLVKRVMNTRPQWKETADSSSMFVNFKWQQSERGYRYERLILSQNYKQVVNHFEHHKEISNKMHLLKNLTIYCEKHKLNAFDYTPLTFILDFSDENCDYNVTQFLKTYEQFAPKKPTAKQMLDVKRRLRGNFSNGYLRDQQTQFTKSIVPPTFLAPESTYMWLLKPTFLNRGRGIHVFDNLETLVKLIAEYQEGYVEKNLKDGGSDDEEEKIKEKELMLQSAPSGKKVDPNTYIRQQATGPSIIKSHSFVVQKYIERPALINKRKFDIRVWSLITHELDAYFFPEGYIRTSSEDFSYNVDNQFVHLTNNAIQKFSSNYGQFEAGNQLSFKTYQQYLDDHKINVQVSTLVQKMKERIWMTFSSIKNKINFEERKYCFEIFGFDFILDSDHEVWLIEVNTNPCIEESSPLLACYIPRMIDDAFKMTLDVLFPTNHKSSLPQLQQLPRIKEENVSEFPVPGYASDENMWFLLGSLCDRKKKTKK